MKEQPDQKDSVAMERRIKELEERLIMAELKAEGLELMTEIAEDSLNIPVRKKSDTR